MSDLAVGTPTAAPRSKVLVGGLVLVLALAIFAAAFIYAGGIGIVSQLLSGRTAVQTAVNTGPGATKTPSAPAAATAGTIPSGVMEDFGKRLFLEQIESQKNIAHLAKGDITAFKVDSVKVETDRTIVNITAIFKDGTKAPGGIVLKQDNKQYYVFNIAGLRTSGTGGFADDVNAAGNINKNMSIAALMAELGVKSFEQPLLATLLSEQKSNQAIVSGIVAGTYTNCTVGAPVSGAGTISIPVELTGKETASGQITIIKQKIDGHEYQFISSFKKK